MNKQRKKKFNLNERVRVYGPTAWGAASACFAGGGDSTGPVGCTLYVPDGRQIARGEAQAWFTDGRPSTTLGDTIGLPTFFAADKVEKKQAC